MATNTPELLKRYAAGRPVNKSQLAELITDGLVATTDDGTTYLTQAGHDHLTTPGAPND